MRRFLLFPLILLCSCVTMIKVESPQETTIRNNNYPYFDPGMKIHYQLTHDDHFLHLRFNTNDRTVITKILTSGLRICFDNRGRRHSQVFLEYPLVQPQVFSERILEQSSNYRRSNMDLNAQISAIPDAALFSNRGALTQFEPSSKECGFRVSITSHRNNTLNYDLWVPIEKISSTGIAGLSRFSVGIVTARPNVPRIAAGMPDISGSDAMGPVATYDRYGNRVENGKTFASNSGGSPDVRIRTSEAPSSLKIAQVDRFNRWGRYKTQYHTELWFKVDFH